MIDQALEIVVAKLNGHLAGRYRLNDEVVVLSPLTDSEGKPADEVRNKLAFFVTNIAHDAVPRNAQTKQASMIGSAVTPNPLHLDIYVMLASAYDVQNYGEGLKILSAALMFFQAHPIISPQNTPDLPNKISQLSFEISNLRVEEMGQMWGNLGGRYVPSVMFKIRTITLSADSIIDIAPSIRAPASKAHPKPELTG